MRKYYEYQKQNGEFLYFYHNTKASDDKSHKCINYLADIEMADNYTDIQGGLYSITRTPVRNHTVTPCSQFTSNQSLNDVIKQDPNLTSIDFLDWSIAKLKDRQPMKRAELIEVIEHVIKSPTWNGLRDADALLKHLDNNQECIRDMYYEMLDREDALYY